MCLRVFEIGREGYSSSQARYPGGERTSGIGSYLRELSIRWCGTGQPETATYYFQSASKSCPLFGGNAAGTFLAHAMAFELCSIVRRLCVKTPRSICVPTLAAPGAYDMQKARNNQAARNGLLRELVGCQVGHGLLSEHMLYQLCIYTRRSSENADALMQIP